MSEWKMQRLEEVVKLKRGFDLATPNRRPGKFPVIGSAGVSGWHDEGPIAGPAVVLGRAGASMGIVNYYNVDQFWPLNTSLFVEDFLGNNPRFIFYLFQMTDLTGFNSGSAQPMLNRNYIRNVRVMLPGYPEQEEIASTLGVLDDKIAVNDRGAAAAGRLAQTIFTSLVAGIAPGPDTFGSAAAVFGGGTPRTSEPDYWDGTISWTTPSDATALSAPYLFKTERTISEAGLACCASQLYPAGSIFMTSRATIGAFAIPQVPAAVNQGFIVVVPPKPELRWWLFHEMRSRVDEMLSLANGSTFLELSRTNFKQMPVRLAPAEVVTQFHERVDPLHRKAAACEAESSTLRKLRDALLPRLMSGEVRVREAERVVESVT